MTIKVRIRKDTDDDKKYPNGISSTVLAIYQYWLSSVKGGPLKRITRQQFLARSNFMTVYRAAVTKFPGSKKQPKTLGSVAGMLNDLSYGRHDLNYYKLRSLAEFVRLPTGIFLLFTHCVSLERGRHAPSNENPARASNPKTECLAVLDGLQRIINLARLRLLNGEDVFMHRYEEANPDSYLPNMKTLKAWSDAYNQASEKSAP